MLFQTSILTISFSFKNVNLIQFKESELILVSFLLLMSWMSYHWSTFADQSFSSPGLLSINKSVSTFGSRRYWFLKLDLCTSSSNSLILYRVCIKLHGDICLISFSCGVISFLIEITLSWMCCHYRALSPSLKAVTNPVLFYSLSNAKWSV